LIDEQTYALWADLDANGVPGTWWGGRADELRSRSVPTGEAVGAVISWAMLHYGELRPLAALLVLGVPPPLKIGRALAVLMRGPKALPGRGTLKFALVCSLRSGRRGRPPVKEKDQRDALAEFAASGDFDALGERLNVSAARAKEDVLAKALLLGELRPLAALLERGGVPTPRICRLLGDMIEGVVMAKGKQPPAYVLKSKSLTRQGGRPVSLDSVERDRTAHAYALARRDDGLPYKAVVAELEELGMGRETARAIVDGKRARIKRG
jgi:hypothetical protein